MYSATALEVMRLRAKPTPDAPVFAMLHARMLERAEQRLIAERDPATRVEHALSDLDAADTVTAMLRRITGTARKIASIGKTLTHPLQRVMDRLERQRQRRDEERTAQQLAFRSVLPDLIAAVAARFTYLRVMSAIADTDIPPPRLDDVHRSIAAPRPGPRAGTALAAA